MLANSINNDAHNDLGIDSLPLSAHHGLKESYRFAQQVKMTVAMMMTTTTTAITTMKAADIQIGQVSCSCFAALCPLLTALASPQRACLAMLRASALKFGHKERLEKRRVRCRRAVDFFEVAKICVTPEFFPTQSAKKVPLQVHTSHSRRQQRAFRARQSLERNLSLH